MTAPTPTRVVCDSPDATARLAAAVAALVEPGQVVELVGELGAGKTTFVAAYARALGVTAPVTSPTFTLVHRYRCGAGAGVATLYHADLWRLERPGELADLDLDELLDDDAAAIVEWADRARVAPDRPRITVRLEVAGESERVATVELAAAGLGEAAAARLAT